MEVKQKKLMHTYSHNAITHQKNGSYSSTTATLHAGSIRKKSQFSDFVMLIIKQAPRFLTAVEDGIIPYSIFWYLYICFQRAQVKYMHILMQLSQ